MLINKPHKRGNLVCVATTAGQMHAQILKSKLELLGIPALLEYESAGIVLGLTIDGLGEVRVMVPEEFEAEAYQAITPDEEPLSELPDEDELEADE